MTRGIPVRTGLVLSGGGSLLALFPAALAGTIPAIVVGAVGLLLVTAGTNRHSDFAINVGALCLFGTIVFAGIAQVGAIGLVVGTLGAVIAWDSATRAVVIQRQLSPTADSRRTQFFRAIVTAFVVVVAGIASILSTLVVVPSGSAAVMVLLLVGVLALVAGLTR